MLNDYKGEKPNNVITEEEHKKRPFYKKVSFWVLSALGLFFGGCSVYGLVLGYQYVHAVTEAAHIIADAQSGSSENLIPHNKKNLVAQDNYKMCRVDLGSLNFGYSTASGHERFFTTGIAPYIVRPSANSVAGKIMCEKYQTDTSNNVYNHFADNTIGVATGGDINIYDLSAGSDPNAFKTSLSGVYLYYFAYADADVLSVYEEGYQSGYAEGEGHGYQDGYQKGYADGSDAINLSQSVKVLLPVGNEYSVQYKSYVDGVVDRQGQLNSSQTGGAYATFDRSRNQKLRIDLTLPSGSRAFFLYTPSWTSAYPTDENYSLRQSWAVSGVTYLPTWVSKPQIYVGVTSADVPDLTYETISVAFDVDHWGDIKVGAYSQGYNDGYQAGEENPTAYDSGYDAGYEQGYDDGHTLGVAQGESQAVSGQKALVNMFVTAFQQPFDQIYRFLNFNVLGLNILALFTALLTLSIGIIIIKKVI